MITAFLSLLSLAAVTLATFAVFAFVSVCKVNRSLRNALADAFAQMEERRSHCGPGNAHDRRKRSRAEWRDAARACAWRDGINF